MGNIFGTQRKNSLQPNAQPSGTQPTVARRDALAVCSPWGAGGVTTNCARRRAQSHKNLQKTQAQKPKHATKSDTQNWNQKLYPKLEPQLVPSPIVI